MELGMFEDINCNLEWVHIVFLSDMSYGRMAFDNEKKRLWYLVDINSPLDSFARKALADKDLQDIIYDSMYEARKAGIGTFKLPFKDLQREAYFIEVGNKFTLERIQLVAFFESYERSA